METTFTWMFLILLHLIQMLKNSGNITLTEHNSLLMYSEKNFFFKWDFALVSDTICDTGLLFLGYYQSASLLSLLTWVTGSLENLSWNSYSIWKFILHTIYIYSNPFENPLDFLVRGLGYYSWWQENSAVVKSWQDEEVWCYFIAHFFHSITHCSARTVGHSFRVFQFWGVFFFHLESQEWK